MIRAAVMSMLLALPLVQPPPAAACSGTRIRDDAITDEFAAAAVIFTGTAVKRDEPFSLGIQTSADMIGWTFVVDSVEKGEVGDRIRVESPLHEGACGARFRFGQRYRIFAYDLSGTLETYGSDVTQLAPLENPPPTEPGGLTLGELPLLGMGVWLVVLGGLVWRFRRRRSAACW
jgi:hypothetical protein